MRRKPIVCLRSVAVVMLLLWTLMLGVNAEEAYTSWDYPKWEGISIRPAYV